MKFKSCNNYHYGKEKKFNVTGAQRRSIYIHITNYYNYPCLNADLQILKTEKKKLN